MELEQLLVILLIGAIAGWLAGQITKGGGFGIIGNIILGVIGAVVGGWLFDKLDIDIGGEWLGPIVTSTIGAIVLILIIGLFTRKR